MSDLQQKLDAANARIAELEAKHEPDDGVRFHCAHCDYETPKRNIVQLARHVSEKHPSETFLCGTRSGLSSRIMEGLPDCWMKQPNGDRTCLHCGSMSEDDLFDIIEHYLAGDDYLAGDEGYTFSTTDKGYKVYAKRPGVQNASQGGIKFYGHHVDQTHPDFQKRVALFERAVKLSNEKYTSLAERKSNEFKKPE